MLTSRVWISLKWLTGSGHIRKSDLGIEIFFQFLFLLIYRFLYLKKILTDGERAIDIARRSSEVIEEIEKTYQNGNVLIVSHKATIRIMLCSLLGIDVGRYRDRIDMPVAAVSIVE